MNYAMVKRLILKDWYLNRRSIFMAILGGAATMAVILIAGKAGFILGVIALVTILIFIGAHLAMATTIVERKEHTLAFAMSLPISFRELTVSKILGTLFIFFVPWIVLVVAALTLIMVVPTIPHGLLPFTAIMATEILVSTCLVISVAIMSESQGWTVTAILIGNLALNGFGYYVAHIPSIGGVMGSATLSWSPTATILLLAEFTVIALLLGGTFVVQSMKKDFI
jgi:hypothetical protein